MYLPSPQVGRGQMQGNGGTGLGLPIVRQLLRKHNGLLVLSSGGYGEGTRFEMRVDCEIDGTVEDLEQPSALSEAPIAVEQPFPDDYRALHVEDDGARADTAASVHLSIHIQMNIYLSIYLSTY
jgi:hypothetical protein